MKKLVFAALLLVGCLSVKFAGAQIRLNVNIGSQPEWGPVGYEHAEYYYLPDVDAYYSIHSHKFIVNYRGSWVSVNNLPHEYANYDLYHGYKVVINQPDPWLHADQVRAKYSQFRGHRDQQVIRDSHDEHYRHHWRG
jgi:hypothetical protein